MRFRSFFSSFSIWLRIWLRSWLFGGPAVKIRRTRLG
jgi:hypothetical protein